MKTTYFGALTLALSLSAAPAMAGTILTSGNGQLQLGVQDNGALGVFANSGDLIGITRNGHSDAIADGCLCEGWGLSGNGIAGWSANENQLEADGSGEFNVSSGAGTGMQGSNFASNTFLTSLSTLTLSQLYGQSASGALFRNRVTITNTGADTITDVRYARVLDWDISPTQYAELVTIGGVGASALIFSNDAGFATPDPRLPAPDAWNQQGALAGATTNVNFSKSGPADHGAFFVFSFGDLAAGQSRAFDIFYGATDNEDDALGALAAVGAQVYSLGQSNKDDPQFQDDTTFILAFAGVDDGANGEVPEPATLALIGLGLAGIAARRRRKAG